MAQGYGLPLTPTYSTWGYFIHPDGSFVGPLPSHPENRRYVENKGFTWVADAPAPGARLSPRDIDRDDSGVPKGPDGSTHQRHYYELTPDGQPVPWGLPSVGVGARAATAQTEGYAQSLGMELAGDERRALPAGNPGHPVSEYRQKEEQRIRQLLKDKGVGDEIVLPNGTVQAGNHDRIVQLATQHLRTPEEELEQLDREAVLPGRLVEQGVTRGVAGIDVSRSSLIPGIAPSDKAGQRAAVERGEVTFEDVEVAPGFTLGVPRPAEGVGNTARAAGGETGKATVSEAGPSAPAAGEPGGPAPGSDRPRRGGGGGGG